MRTQVFEHRGILGIQSDFQAEGLLNDPSQPGQLGFVVNADSVDIQPKALDLLKKVKSGHDDIGDVDVFQASDGVVVFAWLGGNLRAMNPDDIQGSNSYHPELLKASENVVTPQEFIDFVESELAEENE
jgi:hypothetical protein